MLTSAKTSEQMAARFFSIGTDNTLVYEDRLFGSLSYKGIRCLVNLIGGRVELYDGQLLIDTFEFGEDAGVACDAAFSGYARRICAGAEAQELRSADATPVAAAKSTLTTLTRSVYLEATLSHV